MLIKKMSVTHRCRVNKNNRFDTRLWFRTYGKCAWDRNHAIIRGSALTWREWGLRLSIKSAPTLIRATLPQHYGLLLHTVNGFELKHAKLLLSSSFLRHFLFFYTSMGSNMVDAQLNSCVPRAQQQLWFALVTPLFNFCVYHMVHHPAMSFSFYQIALF